MYFLKNTDDFWTGQLPISLTLFIILHFLQRLLRKWSRLARLLNGFKWVASFWKIFLDNAQYLSFRAFQQLRDLSSIGLPLGGYYTNLLLLYTTLLLVMLLGIGFYTYLLKWVPRNVLIFWEITKPSKTTICYVSIYFSLKVCTGATHALLY